MSVYDATAKFEVITPHGTVQNLQYTRKALDGTLGMGSYKYMPVNSGTDTLLVS